MIGLCASGNRTLPRMFLLCSLSPIPPPASTSLRLVESYLNEKDEVVALLYRLNREILDEHGNYVETTGMAYAIDAVLNDLQVDIAVTPAVTSVVPNTLAGAALTFGRVVIDGCGFDPSSQITFRDSPVLLSTWVSATRMEVTPPLGLFGTVDVRVSNKWGEWSSPGSEARFHY